MNIEFSNYLQGKCLHQLVEEQVKKTPDAIALIFDEQQLTYAQLNAKANQLAQYLRTQGVMTETLVGICVERSFEMIVGLLAVLKAGGAYVPIDPNYPFERIAFMLEDSQVEILLTQHHLLADLPKLSTQTFCLDTDWQQIETLNSFNLNVEIKETNLAYMIYTSGSTGKPKGVLNEHIAICNRVCWSQEIYNLDTTDCVIQKTPLSFDVSVWEIFGTLISGASLVIAKPEGHKNPQYLISLIQQYHVTTLHFVPSMLHIFLETGALTDCDSIKRVICSGEALNYSLQVHFFKQTAAELYNLYGPTEAAVDVSYWQCQRNSDFNIVPIGYPVANTQLYILDENRQLISNGEMGELYIGGVQVARGYHNRSDMTAEKFIPNPFLTGRLYRTGDIARFLPNGAIEYLGRVDNQVKVHGFRIELGEIEATLLQQSVIQQAAVVVNKGKYGDKKLVAYMIANTDWAKVENSTQENYVALWQALYDETYKQSKNTENLTLNFSGWNSRYTGQALPESEMQEWVEKTVERILSLNPQNVLELGCGTGLLLARLAPHCEQYVGTDIAETGLAHIRQIQKMTGELKNITLHQRAADETLDFDAGSFDTVIINSVIQHFPDISYLLNVLQNAARLLKTDGRIFIGDVPNLLQRETFYTSVSLYQANTNDSITHVRQQIKKLKEGEKDLQFAPAFFLALKRYIPTLHHVQVLPKRGHALNELTRFRYDVVLHFDKTLSIFDNLNWYSWTNFQELENQLNQKNSNVIAVKNISNARLNSERNAVHWLNSATLETMIADFSTANKTGIEPEELYILAEKLGYQLELSWLSDDGEGTFDAVFTPKNQIQKLATFVSEMPHLELNAYSHNPQQTKFQRQLIPSLQDALRAKLPDYMLPSAFFFLDSFPLSPSGKIDRHALEALPVEFIREDAQIEQATNSFEKLLVEIWADVLDLSCVGVEDNFFALGGNSLNAMIVTTRLQKLLNRSVEPLAIFIAPTISALSKQLSAEFSNSLTVREENEIKQRTYPASFAQQHFWTLQQLNPHDSFYTVPFVFQIEGKLNIDVLQQSFNAIVQRHEILRTTLQKKENALIQIIEPQGKIDICVIKLSANSIEEKYIEFQECVKNELSIPFDLSSSGYLRVRLFEQSSEHHFLLLCLHILIYDQHSLNVLLHELGTNYSALIQEKPLDFAPLPMQYGDYAKEQQSLLATSMKQRSDYWTRWFERGEPENWEWQTQKQSHANEFEADILWQQFDFDLTSRLKNFAQQHNATLYMTLLTAYSALLSYYSGSTDIIVGTTFANRSRLELQELLGSTLSVLSLRINLDNQPTWLELLEQSRQIVTQAMVYQDIPFSVIMPIVQPYRQKLTPLFRSIISFLAETAHHELTLHNLNVSFLEHIVNASSRPDLYLTVWENKTNKEANLTGFWLPKKNIFDENDRQFLMQHFARILERMVENPDEIVDDSLHIIFASKMK